MEYEITFLLKNPDTGDLREVDWSVDASSADEAQALAMHHLEQLTIKRMMGQRTH
jgi:hypothetical protein